MASAMALCAATFGRLEHGDGGLHVAQLAVTSNFDGPFDCPTSAYAFSPPVFFERAHIVLTEAADWSYARCPPTYTGRAALHGALVLHVNPGTECPLAHAARAAADAGAAAWLEYAPATAWLGAEPGERRNEFSVHEGGDRRAGARAIAAVSISSRCADSLVASLRRRAASAPAPIGELAPMSSRWSRMWRGAGWLAWRVVVGLASYVAIEVAVLRVHLALSPTRADERPSALTLSFQWLLLVANALRVAYVAADPLGSTGLLPVEANELLLTLRGALQTLGVACFFRHYVAMGVVVNIVPRARGRLLGLGLLALPLTLVACALALAFGRLGGLRWTRQLDDALRALRAGALPGVQAWSGLQLDWAIHRRMQSCPSPLFVDLIVRAKRLNVFLVIHCVVSLTCAYLIHAPSVAFVAGLVGALDEVAAALTMLSARPLGSGAPLVGPAGWLLAFAWRVGVRVARSSPCVKMVTAVTPMPPGGLPAASSGFGSGGPMHHVGALPGLPPHLRLGVTTSFLREYAERLGCDASTKSYTMREMALRATMSSMVSVAELSVEETSSDGYPRVGKASLFISHAHACNYLRMVDAIEAYLELHGLSKEWTYVWVDIFSIRQHQLHTDIAHIGQIELELAHVVVVLDPWDKPVCLTRVWCLYEIVHSLHPSVVLDLTVPRAERMRFVQALAHDLSAVEEQLCSFDARNAQVTVPEDKLVILSLIEEHFGGRFGYVEGEGLSIFNEETRAAIRAALAACSWDM
ncbi:hypothetical protein KFE25_014115 [Diacronema lutheri]|uniref:Uncharacterized protein n=1 Tax=Diacronema lutheri TaxID=2081491 RepID=A0A8J5X9Y6_DIALT|nr:hypothetical protein KFE25_014115 [Diacronema lutheri]